MLHELTTLIGAVRCAACAVVVNLLLIHNAAAATPTVPECLAASDASLQSGNERKRLAEARQAEERKKWKAIHKSVSKHMDTKYGGAGWR